MHYGPDLGHVAQLDPIATIASHSLANHDALAAAVQYYLESKVQTTRTSSPM